MRCRNLLPLMALILVSCAEAHYAPPGNVDHGRPQQQGLTCQAKFASGACVSFAWEKMPTEDEAGSFIFKTFRVNETDGSAVLEDLTGAENRTMSVVLWMSSMGHGSSPVTVERLDVGTFRATNVFFSMKGAWDIRFQVKEGKQVNDQAVVAITL